MHNGENEVAKNCEPQSSKTSMAAGQWDIAARILAAKTLLLKIGMNKIKKSHLSFHDFFSKKVMHWGFYVPHFHFTNFFKKVMYWIHYIDFFKKSDALNPLHRVLWMRWSRDITKVDVMISLHQLFPECIKYYTKRRLFSEIPII